MPILPVIAALAIQISPHTALDERIPSYIDPAGWTYYGLSSDNKTYIFYRLHPRQPVVWIRAEHPNAVSKSTLMQYRVNCELESAVDISFSVYRNHNLRDLVNSEGMGIDQTPPPGSPLGRAVEEICNLI